MNAITGKFKAPDLAAAGIFFLALILRLLYLYQIGDSPFLHHPQIDMLWHHLWAREIASGNILGNEVFFRAPLYPYFLALIYSIFGDGPYAPPLIQSLLGACSCLLIFLSARKIFNRRVAIISGLMAAFYSIFIYFDNELLFTNLLVFLILLLFLLTLKAKTRQTTARIFLIGIVLGLGAITSPTVLVALPILLAYLFWYKTEKIGRIKSAMLKSAVLATGIVLIILPVTVRNYLVGQDFVPISWQGGVNFWIGNNEQADGKTAGAPGYYKTYEEYQDNVKFSSEKTAEKALGRRLKPSENSAYWYGRGLEFIRTHPRDFITLLAKKIYYLGNAYEIESNRDIYAQREYSSLFRILLWHKLLGFPYGIILPLALAGIVFCFRNWRREYFWLLGFLFSYAAMLLLFFITARYRVPLLPFIIMLAAAAIDFLIGSIKKPKSLIFPALIFAIALIFSNSTLLGVIPTERSRSHQALAAIYLQENNLDSAIVHAALAVRDNPGDPAGYDFLGTAYELNGNHSRAAEAFARASQLSPEDAFAFTHLGYNLFKSGQYSQAAEACHQALKIDSTIIDAYTHLGNIYRASGQLQMAMEIMEKGYAVDSGEVSFLNNYAIMLRESGNFQRALEILLRVVQLQPTYLLAHTNLANLYFQTGQPALAEQEYKAALEINPDELSTNLNLAQLYIRTQRNQEAAAILRKVLAKDPGNSTALKLLELAQSARQ